MSAWPFTALPPGTRPDRGSSSTMRTIDTAVLQETARQRLGPHSLVSDDHAPGYPLRADRATGPSGLRGGEEAERRVHGSRHVLVGVRFGVHLPADQLQGVPHHDLTTGHPASH